jgi:serine/threonine protein kinase
MADDGQGASRAPNPDPNRTTVVCRRCGLPLAPGTSGCPRCSEGGAVQEPDSDELIRLRLQEAIGGTYELLELLGRGGMGIVFRAREVALEREVALKVLTLDPVLAPEAYTRFEREAKLAARLDHPGIVPIFSVGSGKGIAYYTMRLVRGGTLEDLIAERRIMDWQRAIGILREVGAALDYAHARGIVHRDIKPANILLGDTGHAAVADFGIARALEGSSEMTGTAIIGSPGYMSPEQWRGDDIDGRADQYALGVVAFEMIAGRRPYEHPRVQELMQLHIGGDIPDITTIRSGLDFSVATTMQRVLAKNPAERFPTTTAFVEALAGRRPSFGVQRQSRAIPVAQPRKRRVGPALVALVTLGAATAFALPQTRPRAVEAWRIARATAADVSTDMAVRAGLMPPPERTMIASGDADSATKATNADSLASAIEEMLSDTTSSVSAYIAPTGSEGARPLTPSTLVPVDTANQVSIVDPMVLARARGLHRRVETGPGYAKVQFVGGIAKVRIDGQTHGTASITPLIVALDSGTHRVSLFASAYTPLQIELHILPGDTAAAVFRTPGRAQAAAETTAAPATGTAATATPDSTAPPPAGGAVTTPPPAGPAGAAGGAPPAGTPPPASPPPPSS